MGLMQRLAALPALELLNHLNVFAFKVPILIDIIQSQAVCFHLSSVCILLFKVDSKSLAETKVLRDNS